MINRDLCHLCERKTDRIIHIIKILKMNYKEIHEIQECLSLRKERIQTEIGNFECTYNVLFLAKTGKLTKQNVSNSYE